MNNFLTILINFNSFFPKLNITHLYSSYYIIIYIGDFYET